MSRSTIAARKQEKLRDRIREVAKQKDNKRCFDCQRQGPHSNVVLAPYNIVVCNQCSGLHRGFGHKTKGISMTAFSETDVKGLEEGGNRRAGRVWHAKLGGDLPVSDETPPAKVQSFMTRVYTKKIYYSQQKIKDGHRVKKPPTSNSSRSSRRSHGSHSTTRSSSRQRKADSHKPKADKPKEKAKTKARHSSRAHAKDDKDDDSSSSSESESSSDFSSSYPSEGERDGSLSSAATSSTSTPRQAPKSKKQASSSSTQSKPAKAAAEGASSSGDNTLDLLDTLMGGLSVTESAAQPNRNQSASPNGGGGVNHRGEPIATGADHMLSAAAAQNGSPQKKKRSPLSIQRSVKLEQATTRLVGLFSQVQEHFHFSDDELKEACKTALVSLARNGHPPGPPAVPIATGYLYPNSMSGPSTQHYAAMARGGGGAGGGAFAGQFLANGGGGGLGANSQRPTPRQSMTRADPAMFDAPRRQVQEVDSNNPFASFDSPAESTSPPLDQHSLQQNGYQGHDANFYGANDLFPSAAASSQATKASSVSGSKRGSNAAAQQNHGIPDAFSAFSNGLAPALSAQRSSVTSDADVDPSNPFEF